MLGTLRFERAGGARQTYSIRASGNEQEKYPKQTDLYVCRLVFFCPLEHVFLSSSDSSVTSMSDITKLCQ